MTTTKESIVTEQQTPKVGDPATIVLHSDTIPAVVTKVNPKSVVVCRVDVDESSKRQTNPGEPYPCLVWDGDLEKIVGSPERFMLRPNGGYANGSIRLVIGSSIKKIDYRY